MTWRLIVEKVATLEELERWWSYDDAVRAVAVLDYRHACELANRPERKE